MSAPLPQAGSSWDAEIRAREEALRVALLTANVIALDELMADDYIVNASTNKVLAKSLLLQLLETGRLRPCRSRAASRRCSATATRWW